MYDFRLSDDEKEVAITIFPTMSAKYGHAQIEADAFTKDQSGAAGSWRVVIRSEQPALDEETIERVRENVQETAARLVTNRLGEFESVYKLLRR